MHQHDSESLERLGTVRRLHVDRWPPPATAGACVDRECVGRSIERVVQALAPVRAMSNFVFASRTFVLLAATATLLSCKSETVTPADDSPASLVVTAGTTKLASGVTVALT